jgi:hypothetical protein
MRSPIKSGAGSSFSSASFQSAALWKIIPPPRLLRDIIRSSMAGPLLNENLFGTLCLRNQLSPLSMTGGIDSSDALNAIEAHRFTAEIPLSPSSL